MKTFKQFLLEARQLKEASKNDKIDIDFEFYSKEFDSWNDSFVSIEYDEKKSKFRWNDNYNVSDYKFSKTKDALEDYKKFLTKKGFKFRGLKL